ncbi:MAG: DMT family transporter [Pseudomonadota bacterium]
MAQMKKRGAQGAHLVFAQHSAARLVSASSISPILADGSRPVGEAWPTDNLRACGAFVNDKSTARQISFYDLPNEALTDSAASMPSPQPALKEPTAIDWLLLAVIVALGGSAFVMIRAAVETVPPPLVAVGRLWVGAAFLFGVMVQAGRRLPPLFRSAQGHIRLSQGWPSMIGVGIIGNAIPFLLFPWAQQRIDSGLAGVYMAFMPIWTLGLAYLFAGETLTARKMAGFALGFIGVIVLMGPDAVKGALDGELAAQLALLAATLCYAASAVITRRAPPIRPRVFAAGMSLTAAVAITPMLFFTKIAPAEWSSLSIITVIGLGLLPTGINGVLIIMLIKRAGAGFMALTNYVTPLWAVAMGALFYNERLEPNAFIALTIILAGVAISQRRRSSKQKLTALHENRSPAD